MNIAVVIAPPSLIAIHYLMSIVNLRRALDKVTGIRNIAAAGRDNKISSA